MDLMTALHKDNTGYDLRDLMIGAEGTLGVITGAVLRLFPRPRAHATAMLGCRTVALAMTALEAVQEVSGGGVEAFEYMPDGYIARHVARMPGAREPFDRRWPVNVLVQVVATNVREAEIAADGKLPLREHLETALAALHEAGTIGDAVIAKSEAEVTEMWARRDAAAELSIAVRPFIVNDVAVPTDRVAAFLEAANARMAALDPGSEPFWVAHLGDGNVHYTVGLSREDIHLKERMVEAVEDVVADLGGSFSAEHGIGVAKLGSMARRKDPVALEVMRAIKGALDPKGLMNPGKVLPTVRRG
jgi:FAD/FMN-containing dehydrogenase